MKKIFLFSAIAIFMSFNLYSQDEFVGNQAQNLIIRSALKSNKVKSMKCFLSYDINPDEKNFASQTFFDAEGKPLYDSTIAMGQNDSLDVFISYYLYNPEGFLTDVNHTLNGNVEYTEYYSYDEKNNLDGGSVAGAEPRRFVYTYGENGHISKRVGWTAFFYEDTLTGEPKDNWSPVDSVTYEFTPSGYFLKLKEEGFGMTRITDYKYDDKNKLIFMGTKAAEGEPYLNSTNYQYDSRNLLIKATNKDELNGTKSLAFEYEFGE